MPCCLLGIALTVVSWFTGNPNKMADEMRAHPTSAPSILVCAVHQGAGHIVPDKH